MWAYVDYSDAELHLARLVRANLAAANRGKYPTTAEEWHVIAKRFDIKPALKPQLGFGACLLDDVLLHDEGSPEQVARWFAHELAEGRLRTECEPPFILPQPHCQGAFHRIARLVETLEDE